MALLEMTLPAEETTTASSSISYNKETINVQQSTCGVQNGNGEIDSQAAALLMMAASLQKPKKQATRTSKYQYSAAELMATASSCYWPLLWLGNERQ